MRRLLLVVSLSLLLSACADAPHKIAPAALPDTTAQSAAIDYAAELAQIYADYWEEQLKLNPIQATQIGDPRYNDRLVNNLTEEFRGKQREFLEGYLARARKYDLAHLAASDRISHEMFLRQLERSLDGLRFPSHLVPVNQFYNPANFFVMFGAGSGAQPFKTPRDYDNWLKRAELIPAQFEQMIANMRRGMAEGIVQPKALMRKVLPQIAAQLVDNAEKSLFWQPIAKMPEDFPAEDRARLSAAYRRAIVDALIPAYQNLHTFIEREYLPACRDSFGLGALPGGAEWYAFQVRNSTTTSLTPEAIHNIGLAEVARIHTEMRAVMRQIGYAGSLQEFFRHLGQDPRFQFESEADLLARYRGFRARLEPLLPKLFSVAPKADFEIRPYEAFRAASAAGGEYQRPSEDGKRPGIFYVNTHNLPSRESWAMEALFLHEAAPGHHFQLAIQQELADLPRFRRFGSLSAFSEGWGLYAETLGKELGVYTDPYAYFGALQSELWRAVRLVVDTGLHAKGWSRDQVIAYMLANSAASATEAESEAERYMAIPGQALAYKIGQLKIKELRGRAESALGARFDVRAFHSEVLRDGSLPLDVLEAKIDRWIATQE